MSYPSVYPTGATVYNPEKCFNGYTVYQAMEHGVLLIDMNGAEKNFWKGLHAFPPKMLPGGRVIGSTGERNTKFSTQDKLNLVQVDWDGNIEWKFDQYEYIEDPGETPQWMARQHHDYQREGNPVGYFTPGMEPKVDSGNTLILGHKNLVEKKISDKVLLDDVIYEVTWDGDIVWEWVFSEHFNELGFSEEAKNVFARNPNIRPSGGGIGDWAHVNSMSALGPNKWYDNGDERFHPDNIIICARELNVTCIISKETGKIVWQLGPEYKEGKLKELGWIIGQHHAHMIPQGLPGAGNILIFDNGGWAGYGAPNPSCEIGHRNVLRDYSRILEIDPVTLDIVWQYTPFEIGLVFPVDFNRFYSPFVSSAQRLPNGNTLITEGASGRMIEVTADHELVWEYISPYWGSVVNINQVYRAYRVPYEWVPQLDTPEEVAIERPDVRDLRVEGAAPKGAQREVSVEGTLPFFSGSTLCVATNVDDEE
ncbi:MAG: aryl-sulfate sulfotransferase [Desulfovibrionales bacterium]|nr:aryl-sulfate sulfotransferase [Desulfovibrionales bacterium]